MRVLRIGRFLAVGVWQTLVSVLQWGPEINLWGRPSENPSSRSPSFEGVFPIWVVFVKLPRVPLSAEIRGIQCRGKEEPTWA